MSLGLKGPTQTKSAVIPDYECSYSTLNQKSSLGIRNVFISQLDQQLSQNTKKLFWKNIRNFFRILFFVLGLGLQSAPGSPYLYYYLFHCIILTYTPILTTEILSGEVQSRETLKKCRADRNMLSELYIVKVDCYILHNFLRSVKLLTL